MDFKGHVSVSVLITAFFYSSNLSSLWFFATDNIDDKRFCISNEISYIKCFKNGQNFMWIVIDDNTLSFKVIILQKSLTKNANTVIEQAS